MSSHEQLRVPASRAATSQSSSAWLHEQPKENASFCCGRSFHSHRCTHPVRKAIDMDGLKDFTIEVFTIPVGDSMQVGERGTLAKFFRCFFSSLWFALRFRCRPFPPPLGLGWSRNLTHEGIHPHPGPQRLGGLALRSVNLETILRESRMLSARFVHELQVHKPAVVCMQEVRLSERQINQWKNLANAIWLQSTEFGPRPCAPRTRYGALTPPAGALAQRTAKH